MLDGQDPVSVDRQTGFVCQFQGFEGLRPGLVGIGILLLLLPVAVVVGRCPSFHGKFIGRSDRYVANAGMSVGFQLELSLVVPSTTNKRDGYGLDSGNPFEFGFGFGQEMGGTQPSSLYFGGTKGGRQLRQGMLFMVFGR